MSYYKFIIISMIIMMIVGIIQDWIDRIKDGKQG